MPLTSAQKQKQYRERKKKAQFLARDWHINELLNRSKDWPSAAKVPDVLSDAYDLGGPICVQYVATTMLEFAAVIELCDQYTVRPKLIHPQMVTGHTGDPSGPGTPQSPHNPPPSRSV